MKKLTIEQQIEALNNALRSFNFEKKYFIFQEPNKPKPSKFAIAYPSELGGVNTCTRFMTYSEMNAYLFGYKDAAQGLKRFTASPQDANNPGDERPAIDPDAIVTAQEEKLTPYQEAMKETVTAWDMVEKYYPNYCSSEEIAISNDLEVIISARNNDDEPEEGSGAEHLLKDLLSSFLNSERSYFDDFLLMQKQTQLIQIYEETLQTMYREIESKKFASLWGIEDVHACNEDDELGYDITDKQAEEILQNVISYHDATIGINWDVIREHIAMYFQNQKNKKA
jgi:hypothetical protein